MQLSPRHGRCVRFFSAVTLLFFAEVGVPGMDSQRPVGATGAFMLMPADIGATTQVTYVFTRAQGSAIPKDRAAEFGRKMKEEISDNSGLTTDIIDISFDDPHLWDNCKHSLCEFVSLWADRCEQKICAKLLFKSKLPQLRNFPHPSHTEEEAFPLPQSLGREISDESRREQRALDMDLPHLADDLIAHHKGNPKYHGVVQ